MTHDTSGPAFPPFHNPLNHDSGMTLRDYFAGQALAGVVAGSAGLIITPEQFAEQSYALADAMLKQRDATKATHQRRQ